MAKDVEFEDYTHTSEDEDGDKHTSSVRAHVVTKDTENEYVTRTGTEEVKTGQVLVETDRPGVYDVLTADAWKDSGYSKSASKSASKSGKSGSGSTSKSGK